MTIKVELDGKKLVELEGEVVFSNGELVGSAALVHAKLTKALREALEAIKTHRDGIQGPDHDYENDDTYQLEAKLYRQIPKLEKLLA